MVPQTSKKLTQLVRANECSTNLQPQIVRKTALN